MPLALVRRLVLLHGFLGGGASWRTVLGDPRLAGAAAWAPDLPGHGASPAPASFAAAVEQLAEEIAARYSEPVVLAGYSLGGRLALGLLAGHSHLFAAALLIGVAPGLGEAERPARAAADAAAAARLRQQGLPAFLAAWREQPLFASQARLPAALVAEQRALNESHDPERLAAALERLSPGRMPDLVPNLRQLSLPVGLLVGGGDAKFLALARAMLEQLPNARLEVAPGAGHNVVLEAPEVVAAALARLAQ